MGLPMASAKDQKFNMVMSVEDKAMLESLSKVDDVSEAQVMRSLIRRSYAEKFPKKRPKK
jgi:hypothetical protein